MDICCLKRTRQYFTVTNVFGISGFPPRLKIRALVSVRPTPETFTEKARNSMRYRFPLPYTTCTGRYPSPDRCLEGGSGEGNPDAGLVLRKVDQAKVANFKQHARNVLPLVRKASCSRVRFARRSARVTVVDIPHCRPSHPHWVIQRTIYCNSARPANEDCGVTVKRANTSPIKNNVQSFSMA